MIKRQIVAGAISALLVVGLAAPALAYGGQNSSDTEAPLLSFLRQSVSGVATLLAQEGDGDTSSGYEGDGASRESRRTEQREEWNAEQRELVDKRREAMKEAFEKRKDEVKERLKGKRLEKCQAREDRINRLIDKGVNFSEGRIEKVQKVEQAVRDFYAKQELESDKFDAAAANVDVKEAEAIAAIETTSDVSFSCEEIDSSTPNQSIRDVHHQRHEALKAYRQSVKELIAIVREALAAKREAAE